MAKFRKKPVIVEAHQWFKNGDHPDVCVVKIDQVEQSFEEYAAPEGEFVRHLWRFTCKQCGQKMQDHGWIKTLEGGHIVCPGDWITTGVHGERYPCKPDIFEKTYEEVHYTSTGEMQ